MKVCKPRAQANAQEHTHHEDAGKHAKHTPRARTKPYTSAQKQKWQKVLNDVAGQIKKKE